MGGYVFKGVEDDGKVLLVKLTSDKPFKFLEEVVKHLKKRVENDHDLITHLLENPYIKDVEHKPVHNP